MYCGDLINARLFVRLDCWFHNASDLRTMVRQGSFHLLGFARIFPLVLTMVHYPQSLHDCVNINADKNIIIFQKLYPNNISFAYV